VLRGAQERQGNCATSISPRGRGSKPQRAETTRPTLKDLAVHCRVGHVGERMGPGHLCPGRRSHCKPNQATATQLGYIYHYPARRAAQPPPDRVFSTKLSSTTSSEPNRLSALGEPHAQKDVSLLSRSPLGVSVFAFYAHRHRRLTASVSDRARLESACHALAIGYSLRRRRLATSRGYGLLWLRRSRDNRGREEWRQTA
jgi:hypothetical protein